jgi:hypothetical protein
MPYKRLYNSVVLCQHVQRWSNSVRPHSSEVVTSRVSPETRGRPSDRKTNGDARRNRESSQDDKNQPNIAIGHGFGWTDPWYVVCNGIVVFFYIGSTVRGCPPSREVRISVLKVYEHPCRNSCRSFDYKFTNRDKLSYIHVTWYFLLIFSPQRR